MGNRICHTCHNKCTPIKVFKGYNSQCINIILDGNKGYCLTTDYKIICDSCIKNNKYQKCSICEKYTDCKKYQITNINAKESYYTLFCNICALKHYISYRID